MPRDGVHRSESGAPWKIRTENRRQGNRTPLRALCWCPAVMDAAPTSPPSTESPPAARAERRRIKAEPFQGFFEREQLRRERGRYTRKILLASIAVHVVVFAALGAWALWRTDELFGPSVEVKVFRAGAPNVPRAVAVPAAQAPR